MSLLSVINDLGFCTHGFTVVKYIWKTILGMEFQLVYKTIGNHVVAFLCEAHLI